MHGALVDYSGSGFVRAGPGTVGKSTASRRLPLPWRSLCDDKTLVVRDRKGRFWAHQRRMEKSTVLHWTRLGQFMQRNAGLPFHTMHRLVVSLEHFDRLLPSESSARLVRFEAGRRVFLKLLSGGQMVGEYDLWLERWYIRSPFRVFVDEQTLPDPKSEVQSQESQ